MDKKKKKIPADKIEEIRSKLVTMRNDAKAAADIRDVKTTERQKIYTADVEYYNQMFPILAESSQATDSSAAQAIERRLASLMRIFMGGKSVGRISATQSQYDEAADKMDKKINQQLEQQGFFTTCYQWLKDTDINLVGVIKVTWDEETEEVEVQQPVTMQQLQQLEQSGHLIHAEPTGQLDGMGSPIFMAVMSYEKTIKATPLVENVPLDELLYTPNARSLDREHCSFVGHRKNVTMSHLYENVKTKTGGMYDKEALDKLSSGNNNHSTSTSEANRQEQPYVQSTSFGDANNKVDIDECYFSYDIDDDGENEYLLATLCGDDFIRDPEINEEEDHPFCVLIHGRDPHRLMPNTGMIDRAGQVQHVIVAVIRQMQASIALGNNPQAFIDTSMFVDIDQMIDGLSIVEVNGRPSEAIHWREPLPMQAMTLQYLEMLRGQLELITGVTRYNQGTDATSLNKTASGMNQIISQGNQALEFVARQDAETGFKRLIERCIFLNQFYQSNSSDPISVRQPGQEDVKISADELQAQYIYQTDVGVGAGTREMNLQLLQQLKAEAPLLVQSGIMDMQGAYMLTRKSYEEAGLQNIDQYLKDPSKQPPQQPQDAPVSESMRIDFDTLPIPVKIQILAKSGIQATPQDFMQQEQMKLQVSGVQEGQKALANVAINHHKSEVNALHGGIKDIAVSHLSKERPTGNTVPGVQQGSIQSNTAGSTQSFSGNGQQGA